MTKTLQDIATALRNPLPDGVGMTAPGTNVFFAAEGAPYYSEAVELGGEKRCFVCAVGKIALEWGAFNPEDPTMDSFFGLLHLDVMSAGYYNPVTTVRDNLRTVISELYEKHEWSLDQIAAWVEGLAE